MIRVANVTQTCGACPSQWEGETADGRSVYVRYRWGKLSVRISDIGGSVADAVRHGRVVFSTVLDPTGWDGVLSYDRLIRLTTGKVVWPSACENEADWS